MPSKPEKPKTGGSAKPPAKGGRQDSIPTKGSSSEGATPKASPAQRKIDSSQADYAATNPNNRQTASRKDGASAQSGAAAKKPQRGGASTQSSQSGSTPGQPGGSSAPAPRKSLGSSIKNTARSVGKGQGAAQDGVSKRQQMKMGAEKLGQAYGIPKPVTRGLLAAIPILMLSVCIFAGGLIGAAVSSSATSAEDMLAVRDLPNGYLDAFTNASKTYDVPMPLLAAIAKVQTDEGRGVAVDQIDRDPKRKDDNVSVTLGVTQPSHVSVYPKLSPPIVVQPSGAEGIFLLKKSAFADHSNVNPQDVKQTSLLMAQLIADEVKSLSKSGTRLSDNPTPDQADTFWAAVVDRLPLYHPGAAGCSLPSPAPSVPEEIQILWGCAIDNADGLRLASSVSSNGDIQYFSDADVSNVLIDDALDVSYAFSNFGTTSCDPNSKGPQGVFPLGSDVANRCDPVTNINAAAARVVAGYSAGAPVEKGWAAVSAGWQTIPFATGAGNFAIGPLPAYQPWAASTDCAAATDVWLKTDPSPFALFSRDAAGWSPADQQNAIALLDGAGSPRLGASCAQAGQPPSVAEWEGFVGDEATSLAGSLGDGDAPDPTTTTTLPGGSILDPTSPSLDTILSGISSYANSVAGAVAPTKYVVGSTALIPRLSTVFITVNRPPVTNVAVTGGGPTDLGQQVVAAAIYFGGFVAGDPRVLAAVNKTGAEMTVPADAASISAATHIDQTVVAAYLNAAAKSASLGAGCAVSWEVIAGEWSIESSNAAGYLPILPNGDVAKPVINPLVVDSDHDKGKYDGDPSGDHAVGPAQFIPATWMTRGVDADGDGIADPQDIWDASLSTINELCKSVGGNIQTDAQLMNAFHNYNPGDPTYPGRVMAAVNGYRALHLAGSAAAPGGAVATASADQVLNNPNIRFENACERQDLASGQIDGRVIGQIVTIASQHKISISALKCDHTSNAGTSNHRFGCAVDIDYIDGVPVSISNATAKAVADAVIASHPSEVGQPWYNSNGSPREFTKDHGNHIHIGYDGCGR